MSEPLAQVWLTDGAHTPMKAGGQQEGVQCRAYGNSVLAAQVFCKCRNILELSLLKIGSLKDRAWR